MNNISQTISSIKAAISEAEKSSGVPIHRVTVGIAGKHIRSLQHSDYIMRENPDKYITDEDIEILKDQVKNWSCFLVKKSFTCFHKSTK